MKTLSQMNELNKGSQSLPSNSGLSRERDLVRTIISNQRKNTSQIYSKIQEKAQVSSILKRG